MNHYEAKQADRKARLEARAVQVEAQLQPPMTVQSKWVKRFHSDSRF